MFYSAKEEITAMHKMDTGRLIKSSRGFAAIISLIVISVLAGILVLSVGENIFTKAQISKELANSAQSYYSAEAGIEDVVLRVIKQYDYNTVNNFTLDGAGINQEIIISGNSATINSSSAYKNDIRKLSINMAKTTTDVAFYYGVQVGKGGVRMDHKSEIIGNIYSDGSIDGNGDATITGDAFVATGTALDETKGKWKIPPDGGSERRFGEENSNFEDIAISYSPLSSGTLAEVSFYVKRTHDSPGDGKIWIVKDSGGSPSTNPADRLTSTKFDHTKIGENYGWANYSFDSPANLIGGNTYWIVIDVPHSNDKFFFIKMDSGYYNESKYSGDWNAGNWISEDPNDYFFQVWIGGSVTYINNVIVGGNAHAHDIRNESRICGDAYYQTIDNKSLTFLNNPKVNYCALPLTPGTAHSGEPDPAVQAMPISDANIRDWETEAEAAGIYDGSVNPDYCNPQDGAVLESGKYICTTFSPKNHAIITVKGTIWVMGNIVIDDDAVLKLDPGYGLTSGLIIADYPGDTANRGKVSLQNDMKLCGSTGYNTVTKDCNPSNGSFLMMLSTYSGDSDKALRVSNNGNGSVFYASAGIVELKNHASLKEVTAYRLEMKEDAKVTYDQGLENAAFASGPGGGWEISSWNETQ